MGKIVSYTLLERDSSAKLSKLVTDWIFEGFQPFGSPIIFLDVDGEKNYVQAMVRYDYSTIPSGPSNG